MTIIRSPWLAEESSNNKPTAVQNFQVGGATTGHSTFLSAGVADGDQFIVYARTVDADGNPTSGAWELSLVTYETSTTPDELQSRVLIASSTAALVDFSGETDDVWLTATNLPNGSEISYFSADISGGTTVTVDNVFEAGYHYEAWIHGLTLANDNQNVLFQFRSGTPATLAALSYAWQGSRMAGSVSVHQNSSQSSVILTGWPLGNVGAFEDMAAHLKFFDPAAAAIPRVEWSTSHTYYSGGSHTSTFATAGYYVASAGAAGFILTNTSGINFDSGTLVLKRIPIAIE